MLRRAKALVGYKLGARDGDIGRVQDFHFDDQSWTIRYLVADTGTWLTGRLVLISPVALGTVDEQAKHVQVDLTRRQIENSPSIDAAQSVERQHEIEVARYYGWPEYWSGPLLWGPVPPPVMPRIGEEAGRATPGTTPAPEQRGESHLRSASEVQGYYIHAQDGDLGHVEDFVIADDDWVVRYLVVDTRNWWPGKKVLLSPLWIKSVDWDTSTVYVELHRDTIKRAPEYDEHRPITREFEARLFEHYQREGYWAQVQRAA